MKFPKSIVLLILCFAPYLNSRQPIHDPIHKEIPSISRFPITLSGFIKFDGYWDSRQVVTDNDGDSTLFPKPKDFDPLCRDINNRGEFNFLDIETRIRTDVHGPEVAKALTHAAIECDFSGGQGIINDYRLRHAYAYFTWDDRVEIILGQFWHPMLVEECAPDQLSADSGNPMALEAREPQFRVTGKFGNFECMITLASQIGSFANNGPVGINSIYSRHSKTPNTNFRFQYKKGDNIAGASIDFKRLRPRLSSNKHFKVNETIASAASTWFWTQQWSERVMTKLAINAGENMTNFQLLSGYAVHSIDPVTDERTYTNLRTIGCWGEFIFTTHNIQPAIFTGWVKNLGSTKTVIPCITNPDGTNEVLIYALSTNIDTVFRFAPRMRFFFNNVTFGVEIEYTRAGYGIILPHGDVFPNVPDAVVRTLFTMFYYF